MSYFGTNVNKYIFLRGKTGKCGLIFILIMSLESLISNARNYLNSHYMYVVDEWLIECVKYLKDHCDEEELNHLVRQQWLLNDLKQMCPGSLPPNLNRLQKTTLDGRFVLQINNALDIGTSAYQQYMKLLKVNMENVEATAKYDEKTPNHRMIKLALTDGEQDISGIEYRLMRNLSCDIIPGCKILLKGPVVCRRGILLLTESVIELLGGEIDEMATFNSLSTILTQKLGLPAIEAPNNGNTDPETDRNYEEPTLEVENQIRLVLEPTNDQNSESVTSVQALRKNPTKRSLDEENIARSKITRIDTSEAVYNDNGYPDDNDAYMNDVFDDDIFPEDEELLRELESGFEATEINQGNGPKEVSSDPFVYIKQINELSDSERLGKVFRVKAQFVKLLSKLAVGKDGWMLKSIITDGTGSLDVEFTSDVLSKLIGFTPQQMSKIKKEISKNPELRAKAVSALEKAKDELRVLYCIMEITMKDTLTITNLIPFEEHHVDLLKKRMQTAPL